MSDRISTRAPSEFARSDVCRFTTWTTKINLIINQTAPNEIQEECNRLAKLVIPSSLYTVLDNVVDPDYSQFAQKLSEQLKASPGEVELSSDPDCNRIIGKWGSIADAHAQLIALDEYTNEARMRRAINPIFLAATSQTNAKLLYEQNVHLRKTQEPVEAPSPVAIGDTLIVHPMPPALLNAFPLNAAFLGSAEFAAASWRHPPPQTNDPLLLDLLMSAVEYKIQEEPTARRQLIYDLSAAQSVRRALGLPNVVLFGWTSDYTAASVVNMFLYACWWRDDSLFTSKRIKVFALSTPLSCLKFYIFLRNLNKRDDTDIATYNPDQAELIKTLQNNLWRAPDRDRSKRKNTDAHGPNPPPAQRALGPPGERMQESEAVNDIMSEGEGSQDSGVSNDFPTSMENEYEADRVLGHSGKAEKHDFGWIIKHVPVAEDWTLQWAKATQIGGGEGVEPLAEEFLF